MNPHASTQYAGRLLMALAVMTTLLLVTAGCGSNNNSAPPPLGGGFSNSSLKGQYVMWQTGTEVNQSGTSADPFSETTVFTADGNGNLNVLEDDFDQDGQQYLPGSGTGTYGIAKDGTGSLSFGGFSFAITLIDDSHFYLIEGDNFATSSGYGQLQDTTAFTAAPSGTFVFKAHNVDTSSRIGGITITGGVISGTEDLLFPGSLLQSQPVASSAAMNTPNSTTGRGTFTLADGSSFGYYVVNSAEFYFMSNASSLEIGQAEAQTGGPFSTATLANGASYVFGSSGDTAISGSGGIHSAGVFTTDGNGSFTGGAVDYVQDTTVNSNLAVTGGTYSLLSNGRGVTNLTLAGGSISPQIFWMVNGNRAYLLSANTATLEDGTFSLQAAAPAISANFQAAFVMDGYDTTLKDRVGIFETTSGTAFNWNQVANAFLPTVPPGPGLVTTIGTTGTYTSGSNGRVAVVVNGVTTTAVFYLSSANSGFMVQEDANIGGAFAQQASQ
jgi:hypothetical protein